MGMNGRFCQCRVGWLLFDTGRHGNARLRGRGRQYDFCSTTGIGRATAVGKQRFIHSPKHLGLGLLSSILGLSQRPLGRSLSLPFSGLFLS